MGGYAVLMGVLRVAPREYHKIKIGGPNRLTHERSWVNKDKIGRCEWPVSEHEHFSVRQVTKQVAHHIPDDLHAGGIQG
jgi:hypothetical protein